MLAEDKRSQLDGIVKQMTTNKESSSNIQFVVDDFKKKYDAPEVAPPTPQKTSPLKTLDEVVAGAGTGVLKSVTQNSELLGKIKDLVPENLKATLLTQHPVLAGVLGLGSQVAPILSAVEKNVGQEAGSLTKLPETTAGRAGYYGEKVAEILYPAELGAKPAGTALKGVGEKLTETAFRPNIAEAERVISYKAKNPLLNRIKAAFTGEDLGAPVTMGDTASRHGLAGFTEGGLGIKAKRAMTDVWQNTVKPALTSIKEKLPKNTVLDDVKKVIMEEAEIGKRKDMLNAFEAVKDDYKHIASWTYETAQDIKATLASHVPEKVWRGKPIAGSYSNVRKIMADVFREKIYSKIAPEVKEAYLDYGNLKQITERGAKALTEAATRGGFGNFASAIIDRLVIPVKTYGGKALQKTGEALKKL